MTFITANSIDADLFPIVTGEDAETIWGMVDRVGIRPKSKRLEEISKDLFGGDGLWRNQSKVLGNQPLQTPSLSSCKSSSLRDLEKSTFFRSKNQRDKQYVASIICKTIILISKRIEAVDTLLSNRGCDGKGPCSDIVGAIYSAAALANDLQSESPGSRMCIAIASDMLNASPNMSQDSILNTRRIVLNSTSTEEAGKKGAEAAISSSIKFPKRLDVRVAIMSIGTGSNPLPREKNATLNAYWTGFWSEAGIKNVNQVTSLNRACVKKSR